MWMWACNSQMEPEQDPRERIMDLALILSDAVQTFQYCKNLRSPHRRMTIGHCRDLQVMPPCCISTVFSTYQLPAVQPFFGPSITRVVTTMHWQTFQVVDRFQGSCRAAHDLHLTCQVTVSLRHHLRSGILILQASKCSPLLQTLAFSPRCWRRTKGSPFICHILYFTCYVLMGSLLVTLVEYSLWIITMGSPPFQFFGLGSACRMCLLSSLLFFKLKRLLLLDWMPWSQNGFQMNDMTIWRSIRKTPTKQVR